MKYILNLITISLFFTTYSLASEMSKADAGTYECLTNPKGEPTGVLYKLALSDDGKWIAEGKFPGQEWKNISCGIACEYRKSTNEEIRKYFPISWIANADISCIQNTAQAFCRYSGKTEPAQNGHMIIALTKGTPIHVRLRKVD